MSTYVMSVNTVGNNARPATRNNSVPAAPPAKPSHVFFGEMSPLILCFPKKRPAKYAIVSLAHVAVNATRMCPPLATPSYELPRSRSRATHSNDKPTYQMPNASAHNRFHECTSSPG